MRANLRFSKMHTQSETPLNLYSLSTAVQSAHLPRVQCGRVGLVIDDHVEEGGIGILRETIHRDAVDCREGHGVEASHVKEPVAANE